MVFICQLGYKQSLFGNSQKQVWFYEIDLHGWSSRIRRLHLCRGVRPPMGVPDMIINNLDLYLLIICPDQALLTSIDQMKERKNKGQEVDNILQELSQILTSQTIKHFLLIHIPKLNVGCRAWKRQQEVLASTWTQIKQNSFRWNKMELYQH